MMTTACRHGTATRLEGILTDLSGGDAHANAPPELHAGLTAEAHHPEITDQAIDERSLTMLMCEWFAQTPVPQRGGARSKRARCRTGATGRRSDRGKRGGKKKGYSKIKLHLTRNASRRRDVSSREALPFWGTSCFPDRGGAGSVSGAYRRPCSRATVGVPIACTMAAGILALALHMNLSSSTPRRLHRDDVERPRGSHRGGSVRVLRGGV